MNVGTRYRLIPFLRWTLGSIYCMLILSAIPTIAYAVLGCTWIAIPWVPVALIGTAGAFIAGFKNTQTYNRMWEARQIWGSIVNSSRTWGILVKDFVRSDDPAQEKALHQELIYRHIAWLTALRFQLRESRAWENVKTKRYNITYKKMYPIAEWESNLADELVPFLSAEDREYILQKKNRATHLVSLQSSRLRRLQEAGHLSALNYVEMENLLKELYDHQGRSERIKNFPYPRQFASINIYFIRLLVTILPLGMLNEFAKLGEYGIWFNIPFSILVGWVFMALEQVGESTENPFEGGANDVPITSITRTIEIDLREMLEETALPPTIQPVNDILT